jgi:hypothetical protein
MVISLKIAKMDASHHKIRKNPVSVLGQLENRKIAILVINATMNRTICFTATQLR